MDHVHMNSQLCAVW